MDYSFIGIPVTEDREKAVRLIQRYDLIALPVVDSDGILLGIVTVDDVLDVAQEETTEDFYKTAAVEPLKESYRDSGVWALYSKRIVWLCVFLALNLITAGVIAAYEDVLRSAITSAICAFFEGNPFVGCVLQTHPRLAETEKLSVFMQQRL